MSDQLAFDFTLPTLQQTPAVRFPPHSVPEPEVRRLSALASKPNAPAEDTFIYGGGSAKEAEFFKMFDRLSAESNRALHTVFDDFCLMGRCIVHNFGMQEPLLARYMPKYEQCHTEYHEREKYYKQPQIVLILNMLKALSELLAWQPDDYLGRYFGQMRLDKHFHGQFFTPVHICEFMAAITFGDGLPPEKPYVKVAEPACGSGAMIIGLIRHLQKQKLNNLGGKLLIMATDIDQLCVNMAYLQLGILGLSVRITHGNTLTNEAWDAFDTPNLQINNCLGYFK